MAISGIGGMGMSSSIQTQLNQILKDFNGLKKIVQEIFKKAEDAQTQSEKELAKEQIKKAEELLEKLKKQVQTVSPMLSQNIQQVEQQIDELKQQLGMPL